MDLTKYLNSSICNIEGGKCYLFNYEPNNMCYEYIAKYERIEDCLPDSVNPPLLIGRTRNAFLHSHSILAKTVHIHKLNYSTVDLTVIDGDFGIADFPDGKGMFIVYIDHNNIPFIYYYNTQSGKIDVGIFNEEFIKNNAIVQSNIFKDKRLFKYLYKNHEFYLDNYYYTNFSKILTPFILSYKAK